MTSYDPQAGEIAERLDDLGQSDAAELIRDMNQWIGKLEKLDYKSEADRNASSDLIAEMAKVHLRAHAHPLPADPAVLHWQMTAGFYAALAARMLQHLHGTDPAKAVQVAEWCNESVADADGDVDLVNEWIASAVAGSSDEFNAWLVDAAQQAKDSNVLYPFAL